MKTDNKTPVVSLTFKINLLTIALIGLSGLLLSLSYLPIFDETTKPLIDKKAYAIAESLGLSFRKAIENEIPLDRLQNTALVFDQVLKENKELKSIMFANPEGSLLYRDSGVNIDKGLTGFIKEKAGQSSRTYVLTSADVFHGLEMPVNYHGIYYGKLFIETDREYYRQVFQDILFDILTVILISFIVALEMLKLTINLLVTRPIELVAHALDEMKKGHYWQRLKSSGLGEFVSIDRQLNAIADSMTSRYRAAAARYENLSTRFAGARGLGDAARSLRAIEAEYLFEPPADVRQYRPGRIPNYRAPFFIFMFSHMLCLSFVPIMSEKMYRPIMGLSKSFLNGLPISAFMLFWALAMPLTGIWLRRLGRRKFIFLGCLISALSLLLTAFVSRYEYFVVLRSLSGVGFGMVFLCVQDIFLRGSQQEERSIASSYFWAAFFSGTVCGTGIGGILADRTGFSGVFIASALAACFSWVLFLFLAEEDKGSGEPKDMKHYDSALGTIIKNIRFSSVVLFLSIPGKIVLTGFLYYLVPLTLHGFGASQSFIGRVLMIFSLAIIFIGPFFARHFSKYFSRAFLSVSGSVLAGSSIIIGFLVHTVYGVVIGVTLLGIARSMYLPVVDALALEAFRDEELKKIGTASVLSIYGLFEKAGNVLGPVIVGLLLSFADTRSALLLIGTGTAACGLLYGVLHLIEGKKAAVS